MSNQYQPLPTEGIVPVGFYTSQHGRVWVRECEPEWVHDTRDTGHYETRYLTELEGCGWRFNGLVTVQLIEDGFAERNAEWRREDQARW